MALPSANAVALPSGCLLCYGIAVPHQPTLVGEPAGAVRHPLGGAACSGQEGGVDEG